MSELNHLIGQAEELRARIEELKAEEKGAVIVQMKEAIETYNVSPEELFDKRRKSATAGTKVAPKWKDPNSNATWSGRGRSPLWYDPNTAIAL